MTSYNTNDRWYRPIYILPLVHYNTEYWFIIGNLLYDVIFMLLQAGSFGDKTMDNKFMYIPNDDKQN